MADVDITPTPLALNVQSDDILDTDGTAISNASANVFVIAADARQGARLILKFTVNGSGDTVTITSGDRPPSPHAGVGDLELTLVASDVRYIIVEGARFTHDDGAIRVTCLDDGTTCYAFEFASETPHVLNP